MSIKTRHGHRQSTLLAFAMMAVPTTLSAFSVIPSSLKVMHPLISSSSSSSVQVSSSPSRGGRQDGGYYDDKDPFGDYDDDDFSHNEGRVYRQPERKNNGGRGRGRQNNSSNNGNFRNQRWGDDDDDDSDFFGHSNNDGHGNNRRGRNSSGNRRSGNERNNDDDNFYEKDRRGGREAGKEYVVDITDTNAHFFSKKKLTDPSLQMQNSPIFDELCQGAGITRPSRIQSLAWPVLSTGKHAIVADQTGSGKTLAYLLPLLKKVLEMPSTQRKYGAPKVLILAPTAELADQICTVCNQIANNAASEATDFHTMVVTANGKFTTSIRDQIRMIQRQQMDVLISTPGRVSTILRTKNSGLDLNDVQTIVLDEVDILLIDDTFGPQLRTVGEAAPPLQETQFVFVTATLPDTIVKTVQEEFGEDVVQVRGPGLHRTAPSLKETLVDVSVPSEFNRDAAMCFDVKAKQLLRALRQNKCRRTLIFCNTVESCRDVENLLNRSDRRGQIYNVGAYHNALTPEARNANLRNFVKSPHQRDGLRGGGGRRRRDVTDSDSILICTDRAARGVDFDSAPVDHVVVFDFPKDPAEYVRRVGRTARAGRKGACTVFAFGWQLPIARQVMGKGTNTKKSMSIAVNDLAELDNSAGKEDENQLYQFRKKHRKNKKSKAALIKENIENGRLWDD